MVDVEHHQSVQMTICQTTMTERSTFSRLSGIELIAAENECRQTILQLLGKGQQSLFVTLCKELLAGTEFDLRSSLLTLGRVRASSTLLSLNRSLLHATFLGQKLLVVFVLQPSCNAIGIVSLHHIENVST